jgi:RNA:NAD 2'-phosphotransferase (TPT1/KptA family)
VSHSIVAEGANHVRVDGQVVLASDVPLTFVRYVSVLTQTDKQIDGHGHMR